MAILNGFIWWLSGHCWGCRVGAKWRFRRNRSAANPIFVANSFLRFCVLLAILDVTDGLYLFTHGIQWSTIAIAVLSGVIGLITGFAHGREEYSPF